MKKHHLLFLIPIVCLILMGFRLNKPAEKRILFKISRSKDAHQVYYELKEQKDGKLLLMDPVEVYWIKQDKGSKREELSYVQRKYAYGLYYYNQSDTQVSFRFVSYNKRSFILKKNRDGVYRVFTFSNSAWVEIDHIYLKIDGGTYWFPKISKVDLYARDAKTGKPVIESVKP